VRMCDYVAGYIRDFVCWTFFGLIGDVIVGGLWLKALGDGLGLLPDCLLLLLWVVHRAPLYNVPSSLSCDRTLSFVLSKELKLTLWPLVSSIAFRNVEIIHLPRSRTMCVFELFTTQA